jgi:hypothetical protein
MKLTYQAASLFLFATLATHAQTPGSGINLNKETPAAPTGARNVTFQNDTTRPVVNISAYVTYPTIQVACPSGSDLSTAVNSCLASLPGTIGGICDARACSANFTWNNATTITTANTVLLLPCGTLTATQSVTISPGVRNATIHGCAYQGGSAASGTAGGTVWNWQSTGTAFIVGDPTDTTDTGGFSMTDLALTTPSAGTNAHAIDFHRVQEINMERLYLIGDGSTDMTGITLDGTGNYSGGTFSSIHIASFGTALTMSGNSTGAANASDFRRLHIDCPTSSGSPIVGTVGINLAYGDGNTFTGGDIENCATMLSLGAGATNNTFLGVRNEHSTAQINAATGSAYNLLIAGGTLCTGCLTDTGTHNSFWDSFHRQTNNLIGDLWRSQADATVTDHVYTGIGLGNVRGRLQEWQTDVPGTPGSYMEAWEWGPGDGTTGLQLWSLQDLVNNVIRFGVQEYTAGGGNAQSFINAAGTGSVCFNCSGSAGTGGVNFASGGASPTTVASIGSDGTTDLWGNLNFYSGTTQAWQWECANLTQCVLNNKNATAPTRVFSATINAATDIDSQTTTAVTVNNTSTAGTGGFAVYEGGANYTVQAFSVSGSGAIQSAGSATIGNGNGNGNITVTSHINQYATADYAGLCSVTTSTSTVTNCNILLTHTYGSTPTCWATPQGNTPPTYAPNYLAYYSGGKVYVYVAATTGSETIQFGLGCFGNPS